MLIIDRFEGNWAVIEHDSQTFNIPRNLLPAVAKEGDVLRVQISVNHKATADRKAKLALDNFFDE